MTDLEIRTKALEFAIRCAESKLAQGTQNPSMDAIVNDVIASAKKMEAYLAKS